MEERFSGTRYERENEMFGTLWERFFFEMRYIYIYIERERERGRWREIERHRERDVLKTIQQRFTVTKTEVRASHERDTPPARGVP